MTSDCSCLECQQFEALWRRNSFCATKCKNLCSQLREEVVSVHVGGLHTLTSMGFS